MHQTPEATRRQRGHARRGHSHEVALSWSADEGGTIQFRDGPEPSSVWTSDQLFVGSFGLTMMATIYDLARRAGYSIRRCEGTAEALVVRHGARTEILAMTLWIRLTVPPVDLEEAMAIVGAAREHCLEAGCAFPIDVYADVQAEDRHCRQVLLHEARVEAA